jgi:hypothetical protein
LGNHINGGVIHAWINRHNTRGLDAMRVTQAPLHGFNGGCVLQWGGQAIKQSLSVSGL